MTFGITLSLVRATLAIMFILSVWVNVGIPADAELTRRDWCSPELEAAWAWSSPGHIEGIEELRFVAAALVSDLMDRRHSMPWDQGSRGYCVVV